MSDSNRAHKKWTYVALEYEYRAIQISVTLMGLLVDITKKNTSDDLFRSSSLSYFQHYPIECRHNK